LDTGWQNCSKRQKRPEFAGKGLAVAAVVVLALLGGCSQGTDEPFPKIGFIPPKPKDFISPAKQAKQKAALKETGKTHVEDTETVIRENSEKIRLKRLKSNNN
jgi:ABC-type sugar transport system substrate-binding protein